jgi:hypothetical protein
MHRAGGVLQRERDGRRSDLALHFAKLNQSAGLPPAARLAADVRTKRLANLIDMAAEISGRRVQLVTGAGDQFRIHGPSLAALPHLVNAARSLTLPSPPMGERDQSA